MQAVGTCESWNFCSRSHLVHFRRDCESSIKRPQLHLRAVHDNARAHVGPGAGRLSPRLGSSRCRSGPEGRRQLPQRDRPRRSMGGNRRRRHVVRRMLVIRLHLQYVFHLRSSCWAGRKTNSVYFRASFIFFTTVVSNMRYTQFTASGTGLEGRYQNFDRSFGTVDIKFLE